MKRTLAVDASQNWSLVGLKPAHRALFRTRIEWLASKHFGDKSPPCLCWRTIPNQPAESIEESASSLNEVLRSPGILAIDRDWLLSPDGRVPQSTAHQIRILWSWSYRGKQDTFWSTEVGLDGVVHDILSLTLWGKVCLQKGFTCLSQRNPLISGIELPTVPLAHAIRR